MSEVCDLDHYRDELPGVTVYENKSVCVKKQDDCILLYYSDPVDKNCKWLRFDKTTALELSEKIIKSLKELGSSIKDMEDYDVKFTEIFSFKENQSGIKTCKWCRYHSQQMTEEDRKELKENLPDYITVNGFGICKMANKKAKEAGYKNFNQPMVSANDGVCILFKMSFLGFLMFGRGENEKSNN